MPWVIFLVSIVFIALGLCLIKALSESYHEYATIFAGFVEGIIGVISLLLLVVAINWSGYVTNIDNRRECVIEKGIVYTEMLDKYQTMLMPQDLTASDSYLELYSEILNYNNEVRNAKKWNEVWWAEGILYDPAYLGVELIPINKGG